MGSLGRLVLISSGLALVCGGSLLAAVPAAYADNCAELIKEKGKTAVLDDPEVLQDCLRTGEGWAVTTGGVVTFGGVVIGTIGLRGRRRLAPRTGDLILDRPPRPSSDHAEVPAPGPTEEQVLDRPTPASSAPADAPAGGGPAAPPPGPGGGTVAPPLGPPPVFGPAPPPVSVGSVPPAGGAAPPPSERVVSGDDARKILWAAQNPGQPYDPTKPLRVPGPGTGLPPGIKGTGWVPKTLPDGSVIIDPDSDIAIVVTGPTPSVPSVPPGPAGPPPPYVPPAGGTGPVGPPPPYQPPTPGGAGPVGPPPPYEPPTPSGPPPGDAPATGGETGPVGPPAPYVPPPEVAQPAPVGPPPPYQPPTPGGVPGQAGPPGSPSPTLKPTAQQARDTLREARKPFQPSPDDATATPGDTGPVGPPPPFGPATSGGTAADPSAPGPVGPPSPASAESVAKAAIDAVRDAVKPIADAANTTREVIKQEMKDKLTDKGVEIGEKIVKKIDDTLKPKPKTEAPPASTTPREEDWVARKVERKRPYDELKNLDPTGVLQIEQSYLSHPDEPPRVNVFAKWRLGEKPRPPTRDEIAAAEKVASHIRAAREEKSAWDRANGSDLTPESIDATRAILDRLKRKTGLDQGQLMDLLDLQPSELDSASESLQSQLDRGKSK